LKQRGTANVLSNKSPPGFELGIESNIFTLKNWGKEMKPRPWVRHSRLKAVSVGYMRSLPIIPNGEEIIQNGEE